jgi:hypothetical protein
MTKNFILVFFLFVSSFTFAHTYYFAFAEVEYNEMNKSLEATIIASAHDVESVLRENDVISKSLDYAKKNKKEYYAINDFINKNFSVYAADSLSFLVLDSSLPPQIEFVMDGFEVLLNGDVQFYLSAKIQNPINQLYVKFDFLMEKFPEQQNKLTFRFRDKKFTNNYLTTTRIQLIKLDS